MNNIEKSTKLAKETRFAVLGRAVAPPPVHPGRRQPGSATRFGKPGI